MKKRIIISLILAVLCVTFFHSSVSPLYNNFYTTYGIHDGGIALLGLSFKEYALPYGPVYYLMAGILGMYGLYLCEIVILTYLMFIISKHLDCIWICFILLIPYIASISTGLLPGFYIACLTFIAYIYRSHKYGGYIVGILAAVGFGIDPYQSFILYGLLIYCFFKGSGKYKLQLILSFTCIVSLIICIYGLSWMNVFVHIDMTSTVLTHKCIKILPVLFILLLAIYVNKQKTLFMIITFITVIFCFINPIDWSYYIYIPVLLFMMFEEFGVNKYSVAISIFTAILFLIPLKNYTVFLITKEYTLQEDLITTLNEYYEEKEERNLLMINVPAYVYLETNTQPLIRYPFQQNRIYNDDAWNYIVDYYDHGEELYMAVKQRGFFSQQCGHYVLNNLISDEKGMYIIYEKSEGEHTHETDE